MMVLAIIANMVVNSAKTNQNVRLAKKDIIFHKIAVMLALKDAKFA